LQRTEKLTRGRRVPGKSTVAAAAFLKQTTQASDAWLAEQLGMGSGFYVSKHLGRLRGERRHPTASLLAALTGGNPNLTSFPSFRRVWTSRLATEGAHKSDHRIDRVSGHHVPSAVGFLETNRVHTAVAPDNDLAQFGVGFRLYVG
jgi:hypothetical protein